MGALSIILIAGLLIFLAYTERRKYAAKQRLITEVQMKEKENTESQAVLKMTTESVLPPYAERAESTPATHFDLVPADSPIENYDLQYEHCWFVLNGLHPEGEIIPLDLGPEDVEEFESDHSCRVYLGKL
jgi:hypothetical protein